MVSCGVLWRALASQLGCRPYCSYMPRSPTSLERTCGESRRSAASGCSLKWSRRYSLISVLQVGLLHCRHVFCLPEPSSSCPPCQNLSVQFMHRFLASLSARHEVWVKQTKRVTSWMIRHGLIAKVGLGFVVLALLGNVTFSLPIDMSPSKLNLLRHLLRGHRGLHHPAAAADVH